MSDPHVDQVCAAIEKQTKELAELRKALHALVGVMDAMDETLGSTNAPPNERGAAPLARIANALERLVDQMPRPPRAGDDHPPQ